MILSNDVIKVQVSCFGAELKSIVTNNVEYLWQGDPHYWKRTSPVLFPIVGKLIDDEYIYDGIQYNLAQHGFARDEEFTLVESFSNKVVYMLTESKETLLNYPFKFILLIGYELIDNKVKVTWTIENKNKGKMYFQIGAHPAFNFTNGSSIDLNTITNRYRFGETPHIETIIKGVEVESIIVNNDTFVRDAIIFDNIDTVTLRDNSKSVELDCTGFPYLGLWTKIVDGVNAPFICLEPWLGITDFTNHDKQLTNKKGVITLMAGEVFSASYIMKFN